MRKQLLTFLLVITVLIFNLSFIFSISLKSFDDTNVIKNIKYLSSDRFKGRLAGTLENRIVSEYIKNYFKKINVSPQKQDYLDPFQVYAPIQINGSPMLEILNKSGKIVKEYEYGKDFKDSFLNFRTNNLQTTPKDEIRIYAGGIDIIQDSKSFRFIIANDNFKFRSSFISDYRSDMPILITPKVYDDLITYSKKGYSIKCFIPYEVQKTNIYNVIGVIKGVNSKLPPLVLSCHFDHLGEDLSGNIYSGALDNASGTAFLLELARYLSSILPPDRDIIIAAFNAEEFGLLGSKAFVDDNASYLLGGKAINFDMIGSNNAIPLTIMSGKNAPRSVLLSDIQNYCKKTSVDYLIEFEDASDHASFINQGIDAISLCDADFSRIHTPDDKAEFISKSAIDRAYKVVWSEISSYAYTYSPMFIYSKRILLSSGVLSCIFFFSLLFINIKKVE
ncbi:peptidase [Clostridium polyendosporum]|uniref:Peptidase n=1 Tax=Clostridium polyendosporum TaxID=69208 RepID=A0A919S0H2_9CLOT|nr:M28 family metallopeptidase [Clostridium polyendosporum]GIM29164.1 peptidase [Clostridium polyendosporum]